MWQALLAWLVSLFRAQASTKPVPRESTTANVVHALLDELQEHLGEHPILLAFSEWLEENIEEHGDELLAPLERAVLAAIAVKYPLLAPVLFSAMNQPQTVQAEPPPASPGQIGA